MKDEDVKTMSLRLDDERAATLEMLARAEGKSVTEAVRDAIDARIDERRQDADFMAKLHALQERDRAIFERLKR